MCGLGHSQPGSPRTGRGAHALSLTSVPGAGRWPGFMERSAVPLLLAPPWAAGLAHSTATVPGEALRQSRWDLGPSCPGAEVTRRNSAAVCLLEASHCGRHIRGEGTKQRAACFQTSASTCPQERAFGTGPQRAQNQEEGARRGLRKGGKHVLRSPLATGSRTGTPLPHRQAAP